MKKLLILALIAASALSQAQQFRLLIDSGKSRIMKLDAQNGSVLDANFIVETSGGPFNFQTPKGVTKVGSEIWISDQLSDCIFRFDLNGTYLSSITTPLDNVRGLNKVGNEVWITNDGGANGGTVDSVYRYSNTGSLLGSFTTTGTSPFDVLQVGNEAYVSDFNTHDIDRYSLSGTFLGSFVNSPGGAGNPHSWSQIATDGTSVFGAAFSGSGARGIYRYNSAGTQTAYWATGGSRGAAIFGNGTVGTTISGQYYLINQTTGVQTLILDEQSTGASFQYFSQDVFDAVPEPASMTILGLGAIALLRKRRK
ncbi:MAG: PEP-CTERM sorting domain-containing protein [Fimbriimonadaceae bacterium]